MRANASTLYRFKVQPVMGQSSACMFSSMNSPAAFGSKQATRPISLNMFKIQATSQEAFVTHTRKLRTLKNVLRFLETPSQMLTSLQQYYVMYTCQTEGT